MDLAAIGLSAVLSALLFIALEFTIILPLFRRIVTKAVNDMVQGQLIPSISKYVDDEVTKLTEALTKSLFSKIRGMLGGRRKGVNAIIERLAAGEDLEDFEDEYEPSTIDKVYEMFQLARPYLPDPSTRKKTTAAENQPDVVEGIRES